MAGEWLLGDAGELAAKLSSRAKTRDLHYYAKNGGLIEKATVRQN